MPCTTCEIKGLIEADRCNNPATGQIDKDIKEGVEVDSDGQVIAYWFSSGHPLASGGMGKMEPGGSPRQTNRAAERVASDGGRAPDNGEACLSWLGH
ncbi:phage portal protein [Paenibacillus larvae]|nr:phage portal protein [Paenibacillus larvae]MDT2243121.1 phage portal protein [Paenibacillus larvae]